MAWLRPEIITFTVEVLAISEVDHLSVNSHENSPFLEHLPVSDSLSLLLQSGGLCSETHLDCPLWKYEKMASYAQFRQKGKNSHKRKTTT